MKNIAVIALFFGNKAFGWMKCVYRFIHSFQNLSVLNLIPYEIHFFNLFVNSVPSRTVSTLK